MTRTTTDRRQANCRVKKERKESSGAVNKSSESEHKMLFSDCVTAATFQSTTTILWEEAFMPDFV